MFANTVSNQWTETTEQTPLTIELIVFDMGEVSFGIPISKLDRVISNSQLNNDLNIRQNVDIIDLHHRLFGTSIFSPTAMVIFRGDRMYGIAIDTTPSLTCVPIDSIRTLPPEFSTNNPLGIATHIAMISRLKAELAIFILGS